ncbi:MAG TPA: hypothetical protein VHZ78_01940 [Rhizomicrobium sp.]|jgi:hypothetical protein|nr:hypothetical protein [Rhizomicrobium sp.]
MRFPAAVTLLFALTAPAFADAPPPGGPGEIVIPGSPDDLLPGRPRTIQSVMPQGVTEMSYEAIVPIIARHAFLAGDFAFFDAKADGYRAAASRTTMGEWELDLLYRSINVSEPQGVAHDSAGFAMLEAKTQGWAAKFPDAPTPHVMYAWLLIQQAWMLESYANEDDDVQQGARYGVQAHALLKQAEDYLLAHKAVASADPEWYAMMIEAVGGEYGQQARRDALLAEGAGRFPDYTPIYGHYLSRLLHDPKSNFAAVDAAIRDAARRTAAHSGDQMYARLYTVVRLCHCDGDDLFGTTRADWPRMRQSFEQIAAAFPDPWVMDEEFFFACEAGDKASAASALKRIGANMAAPSPVWDYGQRALCQSWLADSAAPQGVSPLKPQKPQDAAQSVPAYAQALVAVADLLGAAVAAILRFF